MGLSSFSPLKTNAISWNQKINSDNHLSMSQPIPSPPKKTVGGVDPERKLTSVSPSQVTALLLAKRPAHLLGLGRLGAMNTWRFSTMAGTPKWKVYNGKSYQNGFFRGTPTIYGWPSNWRLMTTELLFDGYLKADIRPTKMTWGRQKMGCTGIHGDVKKENNIFHTILSRQTHMSPGRLCSCRDHG